MVDGGEQRPIAGSRLQMLILCCRHALVALALRRHFSRRWAGRCSTIPTVEADAAGCGVNDGSVVYIMDYGGVYVGYGAVVRIVAAAPVATVEAGAGIPKAIVNSAVETYSWPPKSGVPKVDASPESPISWRPEKSYPRWKHPRAGNPEVAIITVRPVAGFPDVAGPWTQRLRVDG
jgi:hypothetical protein